MLKRKKAAAASTAAGSSQQEGDERSDDDASVYSGGSGQIAPSLASASVDFFHQNKTVTSQDSQGSQTGNSSDSETDVNSIYGEKSDVITEEEDDKEDTSDDDESAHSSMDDKLGGLHSDEEGEGEK